MPFVRTVLGDIDPAELGVTYAHEHLVIAGSRTVEHYPDFRLDDVDKAIEELASAQALGLRSVVDAMPADTGRDVELLAEVSRRSGVHLVAPTGVHHQRYYPERHWSERLSIEEVTGLLVADITDGIDALDYGSPIVKRTPYQAGVIKVAGSTDGPSARDARFFEAATAAQQQTGCPILTHCENGTGALEQAALFATLGARLDHVALSHVDRIVDRGHQRELFASGVSVEYDQGFRWKDAPNGTLQLLEWAAEDGHLDQVVLGLDAARQGYWAAYGGAPGMAFLLGDFAASMRDRGLGDAEQHQLFVTNPARLYAFADA
ncbi:MAG: aryldialkylphosphatase [Chloroflexi bacterium]|nr:aryldialkylphosphatase [Chloroflexota bacterium]